MSRAAVAIRVAICAVFGFSACGDSDPPAASQVAAQPVHQPVVARAIAELSARLPQVAEPPAVESEMVDELVEFLLGADARSRELPLEEIHGIGDGALAELNRIAVDPERPGEARAAAIELIAAVGTRAAGMQLVGLCDSTNEAWVRSHAAWRLSELDPQIDVVIPGLLLRLRSELDHEAAIYVAAALASRGNLAGLEMLTQLAANDANEAARVRAGEQLAAIVTRTSAPDAATLIAQWNGLQPGLQQPEPSDHLRLSAWKWIQTLSGDTFQLRPVDDARFLLIRLGAWIVDPLARALDDDDPYTRLHSAQCLQRMGPLARPAVPQLITALGDPRVAAQAALSLGSIGGPAVLAPLGTALDSGSHEVRVASARALGVLGDVAAISVLEAHSTNAAEPIDLRQAASEAVMILDPSRLAAAQFLAGCLTDPAADVGGAELALDRWLHTATEVNPFTEADQSAWDAADVSAGAIPTPAEARTRREVRARLLESKWSNGGR